MRGRSAGRLPLLPALRQVAAYEDRGVLPRPSGRGRRRPARVRLPDRAEARAAERLARRRGAGGDLARPTRVGTARPLPPRGAAAPAKEPRLAHALAAVGGLGGTG